MMKRRMWSLALGLVCAGMTLSVSGHAGWAPQKPQSVASMSALDLPALKKPITKRFVNAKLSEVLAWLSLERFSFVADVSEFPEQGQVTLNFTSQPLGAVLDAIADAYHGRWERRGDIFTLRSSSRMRGLAGTDLPLLSRTTAALPTLPRTTVGQLPKGEKLWTAPVAPEVPLKTARVVDAPLMATVKGFDRDIKAVTAPEAARAYDVAVAVQDPKSQEEAMRAAEKAMKAAEETIRKLHESGEWQRAMEKAMSHAQGQHSEEMKKAMEEAHRAMRQLHDSKEWKEAWAKAREEIARALKSGKVNEGGKERKMTDQERAHLEKALKNFEKAPEFKFDEKFMKGFEGKTFVMPKMDFKALEKLHETMPKLDEKAMEKLMKEHKTFVMPKIDAKAFEKLHQMEGKVWTMPKMDEKAMEKLMKEHKTFVMPKIDQKAMEKLMKENKAFMLPKGDGRAFTFTVPEGRTFRFAVPGGEGADREARIQQRIQEMRRRSGAGGDAPFRFEVPSVPRPNLERSFMVDSKRMRIGELLESLTPAQREKQEKQGYLTLDDLSPAQREMLGGVPKDGNWTFSYSVDGKRVTIKAK